MDLLTIILLVGIIIGVYIFPSSIIRKFEQKIFSKIVTKHTTSEVIDIEKIKKSLG